jgi:hypothetical protein
LYACALEAYPEIHSTWVAVLRDFCSQVRVR